MRNKYPGTCYVCGRGVQADAGHFEKTSTGWRVQCFTHPIIKRSPMLKELEKLFKKYDIRNADFAARGAAKYIKKPDLLAAYIEGLFQGFRQVDILGPDAIQHGDKIGIVIDGNTSDIEVVT